MLLGSLLAVLREEIDLVRQKAGFIYLSRGDLGLARELLLLGRTDPREVISLFPGRTAFCSVNL